MSRPSRSAATPRLTVVAEAEVANRSQVAIKTKPLNAPSLNAPMPNAPAQFRHGHLPCLCLYPCPARLLWLAWGAAVRSSEKRATRVADRVVDRRRLPGSGARKFLSFPVGTGPANSLRILIGPPWISRQASNGLEWIGARSRMTSSPWWTRRSGWTRRPGQAVAWEVHNTLRVSIRGLEFCGNEPLTGPLRARDDSIEDDARPWRGKKL